MEWRKDDTKYLSYYNFMRQRQKEKDEVELLSFFSCK